MFWDKLDSLEKTYLFLLVFAVLVLIIVYADYHQRTKRKKRN